MGFPERARRVPPTTTTYRTAVLIGITEMLMTPHEGSMGERRNDSRRGEASGRTHGEIMTRGNPTETAASIEIRTAVRWVVSAHGS